MVAAVSMAEIPAPLEVVHSQTGVHYLMQDVIGDYRVADIDEPQAFLTQVITPYGAIRAHFHQAAGFHVFTAGDATMGSVAIRPGAVHYTDAYTPYMGDIKAGPNGYGFLECRTEHATTSYYMPDSAEELRRSGKVPGRQFAHNVDLGAQLRPSEGRSVVETVAQPEADGLAVRLVRMGPGSTDLLLGAVPGKGRYYVVADGAVATRGKTLPPWSCVFLAPAESPPPVVAGPAGADVLMLDFPAA